MVVVVVVVGAVTETTLLCRWLDHCHDVNTIKRRVLPRRAHTTTEGRVLLIGAHTTQGQWRVLPKAHTTIIPCVLETRELRIGYRPRRTGDRSQVRARSLISEQHGIAPPVQGTDKVHNPELGLVHMACGISIIYIGYII